jgi:hypothetical protein
MNSSDDEWVFKRDARVRLLDPEARAWLTQTLELLGHHDWTQQVRDHQPG